MRARLIGGMVFCLAVGSFVQAGEARFEAVLQDLLETLDKLSGTLSGIRDEATAKEAQPELRKSATHWQTLMKKADQVAPPNKEEKDKLEKVYAPKLEKAREKLYVEVRRVRGVDGGREALKEISAVLERKTKD